MKTFKYIIGNERSEVIEHKDFSSSIFADQYILALKAIDRYLNSEIVHPDSWNKHVDQTLRVVAFCGERGDGKSSCMRSVMWIIENLNNPDIFNHKDTQFLKDLNLYSLKRKSFKMLPVIDPAFFDNKHNVLEFIVGQIYSDVMKYGHNVDRIKLNELIKDFQKIKNAILELHAQKSDEYDEISELSSLASAMTLRNLLDDMIGRYLNFIGKDKLIIAIDDIDLNMGKAYEMTEELRKYLGNKHCIILISAKLPQLHSAVAAHMKKENRTLKDAEVFLMASKYIDKLLPSAIRITMPNVYGLSEIPLDILEKDSENEKDIAYKNASIKEGIVELIFQRTRYLFYNSLGGVSPIVPSNLRDLTMLLGLLMSMHQIEPDHSSESQIAKLNSNKQIFKEYFYKEWIQRLSMANQAEIEKWLMPENRFVQNKMIAQYLDNFDLPGRKNYSIREEDEQGYDRFIDHFKKITATDNFSYNVSLGDVFHLIHLLEQDKLNAEQESMLFFIKSHYSIMLYEAYDKITDDLKYLYPSEVEEESVLFRFDRRFTHVNDLQRIVGSYFSYDPSELLPSDKKSSSFDLRKLDLKTDLRNLKESIWDQKIKNAWQIMQRLNSESHNINASNKEDALVIIKTVEFFLLTISRNIPSKETNFNPLTSDFRKSVRPAYVQNLVSPMKYFLFDALMPFAAMTNPQFAYNRFYKLYNQTETDNEGNDFFSLALRTKGTLLREMIETAWKSRHDDTLPDDFDSKLDNLESGYEEYLHNLLSDAVIRNGEVLAAIFANLTSKRYDIRDKTGIDKIVSLYDLIQKSGMATHKVADTEKPYGLKFAFLTPIMNFLKDIDKNSNSSESKDFNFIFKDASIKEQSSEDFDIIWVKPSKEELRDYVSRIWHSTGFKGEKKTLTKRTLIRYYRDCFGIEDIEFRHILNDYEKAKNIEDKINHPYTIDSLTEALYEAEVSIPQYNINIDEVTEDE